MEVEAEAEVGAEAVAAVAIAGGDGISDLGGRGEMRGEACWSELVRQARQQLAAFCFCLMLLVPGGAGGRWI